VGDHVLNSFITRADSTIKLDNLQHFGSILHSVIEKYGCPPAWLFKSDVSAAYRHILMHPLWQIKQVNTFEGQRHVDRNLTFRTRTAPRIWCSFFSLVMWIAIYVYLYPDLLHYMDDAWSYKMDITLAYYKLYDAWYPQKQVKLLLLYNKLSLPHTKKKTSVWPFT